MSINNSHEYLASLVSDDGYVIADHLLVGSNLQIPAETYVPNDETSEYDSVTFQGTGGRDTLFGGGGEVFTFFLGTRGDDLYGIAAFSNAYADYSSARHGVFVDMSYRGSRSFTDAAGEVQTVSIIGKASDGLGGTDYFGAMKAEGLEALSSVTGVFGSAYRDVMIGGGGYDQFYGGRGNDLLIGGWSHGGEGNDKLVGRAEDGSSVALYGDEGDDLIFGTDGPGQTDIYLVGGSGNDRIFAGAGDDRFLTGNEGNDWIDAGAGNDFLDGGVGGDTLISGAGNDRIHLDKEAVPNTPAPNGTDGARDILRVTQDDIGDFNDVASGFEAGRDEVQFREAAAGRAFRVYHEAQPSGASRVNTVLQIDADGDGLGGSTPDTDDYFLTVVGADLSLHRGWLLT